jgi:hypothetical protein
MTSGPHITSSRCGVSLIIGIFSALLHARVRDEVADGQIIDLRGHAIFCNGFKVICPVQSRA